MKVKTAVLLILVAFCIGVLYGIFNWNFLFKGRPADEIHLPRGQHQIVAIVGADQEYIFAVIALEGKDIPRYYKLSRSTLMQNLESLTIVLAGR